MKENVRGRVRQRKVSILRRLAGVQNGGQPNGPVLSPAKPKVEVSARTRATGYGGIVAAHRVAVGSGLAEQIDAGLQLLKIHQPYHESDHVLNLAYNALCGGRCLDDIELRRNDEAYLDALGAIAIPDPTTAGDFCRRFEADDVDGLMKIVNAARLVIWARQPAEFRSRTARLDVDASIIPTTGGSKQGMALSFKGVWGYSALLVTLANTGEPLFIRLYGANRPSHEGAPATLDKAIALVRAGGFEDVLLRGDTDYSMTAHLDRWTGVGVRFVLGYDASKGMKTRAGELDENLYRELVRHAEESFAGKRRARQPRVKEEIVRERNYKNLKLRREDVAEFPYKPGKAKLTYRMIALRKNISVERGDNALFDEIRYFFYITNDRKMDALDVVREANGRCDQENIIGELKSGVRALHAPVNTLVANWAYMVMTSLAWTLKAWMALSLPVSARWRGKHERERRTWLRMGFRTFVNAVICIPAQVLTTGRRTIVRLLAWKPQLHVMLRMLDAW